MFKILARDFSRPLPKWSREASLCSFRALSVKMETENVPPVQGKNSPSPPETKKAKGDVNGDTLPSSLPDSVKERGEIKENAKVQIRFAKLSADACAPTYGSEWAAGADLYSACDCTVPAKVCEYEEETTNLLIRSSSNTLALDARGFGLEDVEHASASKLLQYRFLAEEQLLDTA
uniref:Uncharacterized protein n=1 Tax=Ascaris lumbricoides TaxID=6252 RepID=A0A0M3HXA3_ASCLU